MDPREDPREDLQEGPREDQASDPDGGREAQDHRDLEDQVVVEVDLPHLGRQMRGTTTRDSILWTG